MRFTEKYSIELLLAVGACLLLLSWLSLNQSRTNAELINRNHQAHQAFREQLAKQNPNLRVPES